MLVEKIIFPETSTTFLTALFKQPRNAEAIYHNLLKKGYKKEDVLLIMSKETQKKYFSDGESVKNSLHPKTFERLTLGSANGGIIGVITAAMTIIVDDVLVVPGLGGVLASMFAGVGASVVAGGLVGILRGAELSEVNIKEYENGIKEGGVIIGVNPLNHLKDTPLQSDWMIPDE